jgi:hypothetical protein
MEKSKCEPEASNPAARPKRKAGKENPSAREWLDTGEIWRRQQNQAGGNRNRQRKIKTGSAETNQNQTPRLDVAEKEGKTNNTCDVKTVFSIEINMIISLKYRRHCHPSLI